MGSLPKVNKKNFPKSINDMSEEKLRETLKKKKECDAKALAIVENLCESDVEEEWFLANLQFINQTHFDDVTIERAITKLCGYPLCSQKLEKIPTQQYHISTRYNKVFDISERKNFCSGTCYKSALFVKNQLFTSPLWFRDQEEIPEYKVLKCEKSSLGQEVVFCPDKIKPPHKEGKKEVVKKKETVDESAEKEKKNDNVKKEGVTDKVEVQCSQFSFDQFKEEKKEEGVTKIKGEKEEEAIMKVKEEGKEKALTKNKEKEESAEIGNNKEEKNKQAITTNKEEEKEDLTIKNKKDNKEEGIVESKEEEKEDGMTKNNDQINKQAIKKNKKEEKEHSTTKNKENKVIENKKKTETLQERKNKLQAEKKKEEITGVPKVEKSIFEWFSLNTLFYLYEEHKIKNLLADKASKVKEVLNSRLQMASHNDKIDKMIRLFGLLDTDSFSSGRVNMNLKPLPDYSVLKEEGKALKVKVRAFYGGQLEMKEPDEEEPEEPKKEETISEPIYMPLVDSHSQLPLRRKIVLDKLNRVLPELVRILSTENILQMSDVRNLVSTFTLAPHNITFKPNEWYLVGMIIIKLLSLKGGHLESVVKSESSQSQLSLILMTYELPNDYLEKIVQRLTNCSNIMKKLSDAGS